MVQRPEVYNGPYDHLPYWQIVQVQHPTLRIFEYEEIPRGRVLFSKREHLFYVYMDKVLFKESIKKTFIKAFHLPRKHTYFQRDLHYTTDPEDLEQLFSR